MWRISKKLVNVMYQKKEHMARPAMLFFCPSRLISEKCYAPEMLYLLDFIVKTATISVYLDNDDEIALITIFSKIKDGDE